MFPFRASRPGRSLPLVTYTLIAINVILFFWDRQWHWGGSGVEFADLGLKPEYVYGAIRGRNEWFPMVTLFTCMFLHANFLHLAGNMLYLFTFGTSIEFALGSPRFTLYYLAWGLVASFSQIFVDPHSSAMLVGASGAIGGVLGAYFLLFPASKIEIIVPYLWLPFEVTAWILLGVWFLWQIFGHQQGVANWAHAGGFMAGMATVLIMGGRNAVLKGREREFEDEDQ